MKLIIISSPDGAIEDERLSYLAGYFGVSTETLSVGPDGASLRELFDPASPGPAGLAMHIETLSQIHRALPPGTTARQLLEVRFSNLFVYGISAAAGTGDALKWLTDGAIQALTLRPVQAIHYSVPHSARELCAQLAGQSLRMNREHPAPAFEVRSGCASVETIMAANERPTFVHLRAATLDLYLLAGRVPDLRKPLDRATEQVEDCISALPPLIFLRHCFPRTCWHDEGTTARLIIDDPILTKKYGGLDFDQLKASMLRLGYGASVAFIPWNHWRSSRRSAARFLSADANLSICVHGCDHINHEFQSGPVPVLAQRAALGIERMRKHQTRVGAPFEDVMAFPQGRFSKAAIPALRAANYLAAVNSTCFPTDYAPNDLTVADLLFPAVTRFDGFPIFQRHYPRNMFEFSVDLFLGKPAFIVEHHEYFRDGCRRMEEFVAALQQIEPSLSWPGLSEQMMRTSLRRREGDGPTEIRFFTRRFQFTAKEAETGRYRLSKFEPYPSAVERVLVDAKSVPFGFENGNLVLEVEGVPGQVSSIEVLDRAGSVAPVRSFGATHNARVLVRRGLSEFRDGPLSRHKGLMKAATRAARALKTTGEA